MKNRTSKPIPIEHADGVVRIDGGDEPVARVANRLQVTRRDEAADAGDREILHRSGSRDACTSGVGGDARRAVCRSTAAIRGAFTRSE